MAYVRVLLKVLNGITAIVARTFAYLIFLLILTLTYEVVARYGFNAPTQWSFDATYFICSLMLILGMAYTWQQKGHVSVDLISSRLPRRFTAGLNVSFIIILFFLCWGNIFKVMYPHVQMSWALKERSMTGFMPPIYPYKTWILIGVALLLIQGIVELIKELRVLTTGKDDL